MEKGKLSAVYLTQRDRGHVGKVDWDGLVQGCLGHVGKIIVFI